MEKNDTNIDFEKASLQILSLFEIELRENLQESKSEIERIKYYESFDINDINFKNIFIMIEKDGSYHVYCGNASNEILSIDSKGKIDIKNTDLAKYLEEVDLESLIEENEKVPERLKVISKKTSSKDNYSKEEEIQNDNQDEETKKIEQDLVEQGEDIKIGKHREIKDNKIAERMPDTFEKDKKYEVAEDKISNKTIIITKDENGKYTKNDKIEDGQVATDKLYEISPEGGQKESDIPDQLMRVKNNEKEEIAVNKDEYGELEIQTVQLTSSQKRIARSVQMEGQGNEEQERKEVTDMFEQDGEAILVDEIATKKEILEREYKVTDTSIEELKELDIEVLIEREAEKVKMSKQGFKEYVRNAEGKTLKEKIHNAQEEIIQEYMGNKRPR